GDNYLILHINHDFFFYFFLFLKNHIATQFNMLMDITAIDYPKNKQRFVVVYQMLNTLYNQRVCIKVIVSDNLVIPSLTLIYKSAGWLEREVWDLFGIIFSNHPDLRRILTDYGFQGFPLRKDFPLSG